MSHQQFEPLAQFLTWHDAVTWAIHQHAVGGPKYFVQRIGYGQWEAIQSWIRVL